MKTAIFSFCMLLAANCVSQCIHDSTVLNTPTTEYALVISVTNLNSYTDTYSVNTTGKTWQRITGSSEFCPWTSPFTPLQETEVNTPCVDSVVLNPGQTATWYVQHSNQTGRQIFKHQVGMFWQSHIRDRDWDSGQTIYRVITP